MHRTSRIAGALLVCSIAAGTAASLAQDYPTKPIRIITAEVGGGNDFLARMLAPGMSGSLGQQVVVENRGGAGGAIAADAVARSAHDGYTLLLYASNIWIIPFLRKNLPYDPIRDFAPITWIAKSPSIVVIHPSLPVRDIKQLIALARARPGALNYASGGTGATTHLAAELFKSMAKVNIVRIAYKGNGPALNDLIAGQTQVMFATSGSATPHVKANRLRALAVTSPQPSPLAPGLPTVAESGLPGYESLSIYGIFAPSKTPAAIVGRLNRDIIAVLGRSEIREKLLNTGVETVGSTADEFAAVIKADMARMGKVIREAGITAE